MFDMERPIIVKYNEIRKQNYEFMYISDQKLEILEHLYIQYLLMMNVVEIEKENPEYETIMGQIMQDRDHFSESIQELAETYELHQYDYDDPILSYEHAAYFIRQRSELHPTVIDSYIDANMYYFKNYIEPNVNTTIH